MFKVTVRAFATLGELLGSKTVDVFIPAMTIRELIDMCKVNGEQYWVYSALDIERNKLLSMRVYPSRNTFTSQSFFKGLLKQCRARLNSLWKRAVECWNQFCQTFTHYYNNLRREP